MNSYDSRITVQYTVFNRCSNWLWISSWWLHHKIFALLWMFTNPHPTPNGQLREWWLSGFLASPYQIHMYYWSLSHLCLVLNLVYPYAEITFVLNPKKSQLSLTTWQLYHNVKSYVSLLHITVMLQKWLVAKQLCTVLPAPQMSLSITQWRNRLHREDKTLCHQILFVSLLVSLSE